MVHMKPNKSNAIISKLLFNKQPTIDLHIKEFLSVYTLNKANNFYLLVVNNMCIIMFIHTIVNYVINV